MRLAAYVSPEGIITGLKEKGSVRLYEKNTDKWTETGNFPMDVNEAENLEQLQSILKSAMSML